MTKKPRQELKIKVDDSMFRGCYANTLMVSHTSEEFVLDFILSLPPQGIVTSRVLISPPHLRRIIQALQQNLQKYEERFGPVSEVPPPVTPPSGKGYH